MDISSESDRKPSLFSNPFTIAFAVVVLATIVGMPLLLLERHEEVSDSSTADSAQGIVLGGSGDIVRGEEMAASAGTATTAAPVDELVPGVTGEKDDSTEILAISETSAVEEGIEELVGGRIVLVSSREPGVLMLEDGQRFTSGARMPNGHVIAAIERERIVLERDGVVSVVRLP